LWLSFERTVLLGAIAGFTIYLGLPVGRLRLLSARSRVSLAMFAVGILAFIFVDVIEHAHEIVGAALAGYKSGSQSFAHLVGLVVLLVLGFGLGSAGLAIVERRLRPTATPLPTISGSATADAFAPEEYLRSGEEAALARRSALHTGLVIAVAIGLHNFAEGLAIGVSARAGAIGLATVLVVGFALHNATEGFGIVGPLGSVQPSWRWLGAVGLIGGGPTFIGAMVGYQVTSQPLELAFYALAAGAILYVILEITHGMRRYGHRELGLVLLTAGFAAGILTDLVVTYGGG
jgi:ZIP family zinc transporter